MTQVALRSSQFGGKKYTHDDYIEPLGTMVEIMQSVQQKHKKGGSDILT